jgi:phosphate transport system substrate-binding protein
MLNKLRLKIKELLLVIMLLIVSLAYFSCSRNAANYGESPTTGNIKIAVDETFKNIINDEVNVFDKIYIYAQIHPLYKPEVEAFNDLLKDSVHLIVASRKLSADEKKYFDSKKIFPKETRIAVDGVALIVNKENKDTLITVKSLKQIMLGEITKWNQLNKLSKAEDIKVVFDNTNSSTVRYIIDSVTHSNKLSSKLSALKYNADVVDYISKTPNSLGIIGVSWVSDSNDSTSISFLKKVKVMYVSKEEIATLSNSYQPYQAYIAQKQYPLRRDIYVIECDPKNGLAGGFAAFLASDRGQRIILKAGVVPSTQPVRIVNVKNDF